MVWDVFIVARRTAICNAQGSALFLIDAEEGAMYPVFQRFWGRYSSSISVSRKRRQFSVSPPGEVNRLPPMSRAVSFP